MHWQVRGNEGSVEYYDPEKYKIKLCDCKLINKTNTAMKVFNSGRKDVCGWIECAKYYVGTDWLSVGLERIRYNPIVDPHWRRDGDKGQINWDNSKYKILITDGSKVYILKGDTIL